MAPRYFLTLIQINRSLR